MNIRKSLGLKRLLLGGLLLGLGSVANADIIVPLSPTFDQITIGSKPYQTKIKDGVDIKIQSGDNGFVKKFIKLLEAAKIPASHSSAAYLSYELKAFKVEGRELDSPSQKTYSLSWRMLPNEQVRHDDDANVYDSYKRLRSVNFTGEATNEIIGLLVKAGVPNSTPDTSYKVYDAGKDYSIYCVDNGTLTEHISSHCSFYLTE